MASSVMSAATECVMVLGERSADAAGVGLNQTDTRLFSRGQATDHAQTKFQRSTDDPNTAAKVSRT